MNPFEGFFVCCDCDQREFGRTVTVLASKKLYGIGIEFRENVDGTLVVNRILRAGIFEYCCRSQSIWLEAANRFLVCILRNLSSHALAVCPRACVQVAQGSSRRYTLRSRRNARLQTAARKSFSPHTRPEGLDRARDLPSRQHADRHVPRTTMDRRGVLELCRLLLVRLPRRAVLTAYASEKLCLRTFQDHTSAPSPSTSPQRASAAPRLHCRAVSSIVGRPRWGF